MSIEIITSLLEAKRAQAEAKRREADILDAEARGLQAALDALRQTLTAAAAIIGPSCASASENDVYRRPIGGRSICRWASQSERWAPARFAVEQMEKAFA